MFTRLRFRGIIAALAVMISLAAPAGVSAAPKQISHCFNGDTDLNQKFGVTETIAWYTCPDLEPGRKFRVAQAWVMNPTFDVIPDGFVPAGATPLDDFLAKVAGRTVIVDPGTRQERVYSFTNVGDIYSAFDADGSLVNGVRLGLLQPLSPGVHVIQTSWTMSAMHCDGFVDGGCLMPGENPEFPFEVTVTPPRA